MPRCDRCKKRGIEERCFYHPAPLTKPRLSNDEGHSGDVRPCKRRRVSRQNQAAQQEFSPSSPSGEKLADAVAADVYHPGFLGPGSYAVLLPQDDIDTPIERETSIASERSDRELTHQYALTKSMRRQMATDVLSALRHYDAIKALILWYNDNNQAGVVPAPLQIDMLNALEPMVDKHNLRHRTPSFELTDLVLSNTSRPFLVSRSLEASDFHILCSGENIRFEMLGYLFSIAGRALSYGPPNLDNCVMNQNMRLQIIDELLRSSTTCLFLCTMLATVNDLTIWMYHDNYLFTATTCGHAGPPSWRRIGELATQMYALGIHKESTSSKVPAWLRETRRRVFCASYNYDKQICTFLGRPIRISLRHTDIVPPLDLTDEEVTNEQPEFDAAAQMLDENGWNTQGKWLRASWIRLRYTLNRFREEILEFSFAKLDQSTEAELLSISERNRASWASLPAHLHSENSHADGNKLLTVYYMLIAVHLTKLYNEFMIQKLLDRQPLTSHAALLRVSMDLLSNVLAICAIRDRSYDVLRDQLGCIILFGLPAASVLATALKGQHRTSAPFPPEVSRAEIVRMLSVLISHLDAAAHVENSGARQGEANYNLCRKASRIFTRVIDAVLDSVPANEEVTLSGENLGLEIGLSDFLGPGFDAFGGVDFSGFGAGGGAGVGVGGAGDVIDWGALSLFPDGS